MNEDEIAKLLKMFDKCRNVFSDIATKDISDDAREVLVTYLKNGLSKLNEYVSKSM